MFPFERREKTINYSFIFFVNETRSEYLLSISLAISSHNILLMFHIVRSHSHDTKSLSFCLGAGMKWKGRVGFSMLKSFAVINVLALMEHVPAIIREKRRVSSAPLHVTASFPYITLGSIYLTFAQMYKKREYRRGRPVRERRATNVTP